LDFLQCEIKGKTMSDKGSARIWLLAVLAVAVAVFGYYLYSVKGFDEAKEQVDVEVVSVEEVEVQPAKTAALEDEPGKKQDAPGKKQDESATLEKGESGPTEETKQVVKGKINNQPLSAIEPGLPPGQGKEYCKKMEEYVVGYFKYLDEDTQMDPATKKIDAFNHFKRIVKDLEKRPPIPAGEGSSPTTVMIANIFHFSRALDRKDIAFLKNVIGSDKDTMEINLDMFFRWLMLDRHCPDSNGCRPSFDALYKYAGFFLNTTGGRSYMFRRSTAVRLLTTYYSLLIIHKADRLGLNQYGIDALPFIRSAKEEIGFYPDFEFQDEYMGNLLMMEKYYMRRR